jgi:hypothetical protein
MDNLARWRAQQPETLTRPCHPASGIAQGARLPAGRLLLGSSDPVMADDELLAGRARDCLREAAGVGMDHG